MKARWRFAMVALSLAVLGAVSTRGADPGAASSTDRIVAGFTVTPIADGVWRLSDNHEVNAYLVEGTARALLVDTCTGRKNIARCVAQLTKLPVDVILTHGHYDHSGGIAPWGRAYAHRADWGLIAAALPRGVRVRLSDVRDGQRIDLGGRELEVIEVPGHTPGSIVLLDAAHRLLFAGDNDNGLVWLFLKDCLPLETYLDSLRKLNARAREFDTVLPGHGTPLDAAFVAEQVACAEQIVSGAYQRKNYRWHGGWALQWTFRRATIAFDPEKIHGER